MNQVNKSNPVGHMLTSVKGARVALTAVLLIFITLFGVFSSAKAPERNGQSPADSESARVSEILQSFPDADKQSVLVIAAADSGSPLTAANIAALEDLKPFLDAHAAGETSGPLLSEDERAAVFVTPVAAHENNAEMAQVIEALRADLTTQTPVEISIFVTGGPAFGADVAAAFDGADFTLLLVTIIIVAMLLIITYRSPILWIFPLLAVGLGAGLAGRLTAAAGAAWGLEFDSGIISVLVFGAGTNYALLLISRYREELRVLTDHRAALAKAWRATLPAILASNITVILALLTLSFAELPMTKGLGIPAAIGLLTALVSILFLLPPMLAMLGKKIFWPLIPRAQEGVQHAGFWNKIATNVVHHPVRSLLAGLALLAVMSAGLFGATTGLTQLEKFRVQADSAAGLEVLSSHFAPGEAAPIFVISNTAKAEQVTEAITEMPNIVRAHAAGSTTTGDPLTKILVTSEFGPSTKESFAQVTQLRETVHTIPDADALVGGATATDLDANLANQADLNLIAPLVLAVSFIILMLLLRSLLAPTLLLIVNIISALAAIGAGTWLSSTLFGWHSLDAQVPLLAFLFLVALGIDYTIFLVHRARLETKTLGTRDGMIAAVTHTGSVITSAGVVLAAVFAALGVLPLVVLGQLGLIVGVGVIVDTFVVRGMIVPALFGLLGDRIWWPSHKR